MKATEVRERAFAMPLTQPAYPHDYLDSDPSRQAFAEYGSRCSCQGESWTV